MQLQITGLRLLSYSWFHIKGTWSVHSFNADYLSIPEGTSSCGYLFHEIPGIIIDLQVWIWINHNLANGVTHLWATGLHLQVYDGRLTNVTSIAVNDEVTPPPGSNLLIICDTYATLYNKRIWFVLIFILILMVLWRQLEQRRSSLLDDGQGHLKVWPWLWLLYESIA